MGILCTSTGMNRIDDGRIVEAGSDCHGRIQPVRDSSQGGPDQPGRSVPNDLAGRLGIARSLRPYTRSESNVARDLEEVSRFFGIKKTSKVMATLTGATSSSLSRAGGRGPASGAEPAGQDRRPRCPRHRDAQVPRRGFRRAPAGGGHVPLASLRAHGDRVRPATTSRGPLGPGGSRAGSSRNQGGPQATPAAAEAWPGVRDETPVTRGLGASPDHSVGPGS